MDPSWDLSIGESIRGMILQVSTQQEMEIGHASSFGIM